MKQGWKIKKLGEVCSLIADGDWIESRHQSDDGIRLIQTGNIGNGVFRAKDDKPHYISESTFVELGCTEIFAGDCLVSRLPDPVGRACIIPETNCRMITAVDCSIIRFNSDIVSKFFIYYTQCEKYRRDIDNNTTGTTRKRISRKNLESICIPIPPREEQERIVAELDCLSGVIEKKREQLKQLDALAQSIFYQMFGDPITNEKRWEVKPLKNSVVEMFLGPFGSALKTDCYVSKEDAYCMVYEQKHAIKKTMELETHYIDKDKFESLKRFEVHSGDFIMSCRGTIGEIYRLPNDAPIGIIHPSLMKIRIKEDVYHPTFFIRLLTHIVKNENTNGNCVQMAITAKELGAREPIVPPLALQQEFADKIEAIEKQKELIKQSITQTEELFNSRMDYYFN